MKISGQQRATLDFALRAALSARTLLLDLYPNQARQGGVLFGKSDTLSLDAIPEIVVERGLREFNPQIPLITEENGASYEPESLEYEMVMVSDPTDRSKQFADFLERLQKKDDQMKIGDHLASAETRNEWEAIGSSPVLVTGATIAISCVHHKMPLFAVVLNYITGTLFMACPTGSYSLETSTMNEAELASLTSIVVSSKGSEIKFPSVDERHLRGDVLLRFTTFLKKSGYTENLNDSMVFLGEPNKFVAYDAPGGPSRVLYLSTANSGEGELPLGFIAANGEKITEWMHWLPFIRFSENQDGAPALKLFEVSIERPWTKGGVLMSTAPAYSIFRQQDGVFQVDMSRLRPHQDPSQYRAMLVVVPHDNMRVINLMLQHGYREIFFDL